MTRGPATPPTSRGWGERDWSRAPCAHAPSSATPSPRELTALGDSGRSPTLALPVRHTGQLAVRGQPPEAQGLREGQAPAAGHGPDSHGDFGAADTAAKLENSFFGFSVPHSGQGGAVSDRVRCRCSNTASQDAHLYS